VTGLGDAYNDETFSLMMRELLVSGTAAVSLGAGRRKHDLEELQKCKLEKRIRKSPTGGPVSNSVDVCAS
jgi:hypothetical protein